MESVDLSHTTDEQLLADKAVLEARLISIKNRPDRDFLYNLVEANMFETALNNLNRERERRGI